MFINEKEKKSYDIFIFCIGLNDKYFLCDLRVLCVISVNLN